MTRWLSALVWTLAACVSAPPDRGREPARPAGPQPPRQGVEAAIVELANAERARANVAPLRPNTRLVKAAQLQADQAARAGRIEHVLPGTPYPRPEDRLAAVEYLWQAWAENLALGDPTPAGVVANWMRSAGHRMNIMNPAYSETGVGHAVDRRGRPYYVQLFAGPRR